MVTTASPATDYTITRVPTWIVPSRTRHGKSHTVTQITASGELQCSCEAGQYNKTCWHRDFVRDGHAGKMRIRIRPVPLPVRVQPSRPITQADVDELYGDPQPLVRRGRDLVMGGLREPAA